MSKRLTTLLFVFLTICSIAQDRYYSFIENKGQWPESVSFKAELESGDLYLETKSFTFNFWDLSEIRALHGNGKFDSLVAAKPPVIKGHAYKVNFIQSLPNPNFTTSETQSPLTNYYLGNDESKWASNCKSFGVVNYENLYTGIDLKVYSNDFFLKYDFIIEAGADPSDIAFEYEGIDGVTLKDGRLLVDLSINQIIEQKPIAYQVINRKQVFIPCEYKLKGNRVSFKFPKGYDSTYPVIIDPELAFSTYSGSTADNFGYTATYDSEGNLYSGSSVFGGGYPFVLGSYEDTWAGGTGSGTLIGTDIGISKYDASGTFLQYSTYLGGESDELPHSLIVDDQDQLFVYGTSSSPDYPVTTGAYDEEFDGGSSFAPEGVGVDYENGSDIIVSKFNADGSDLLASTFVGGSGNDGVNTANGLKFNYADDMRGEILIDLNGDILVASCTYSEDFPTINAFQVNLSGDQDACLFKITNDLSTMLWSTYIGGDDGDAAYSLDINSENDIYVCGGTESSDFFITFGTFQQDNEGGDADGFIFKMNEEGTNITESTYYGTAAYDQCYFVEIDQNDDVYVFGQTKTLTDYFIFNADYNQPESGMLVSKFNPELSIREWSTVFGTGSGSPNLSPTAFLVDDCQRIYMSGWGGSTNVSSTGGEADFVTGMETTDDAFQETTDGSDFYLLVLNNTVSDILYGSFFGGNISSEHVDGGTSRFSPDGTVYQSVCAGCGSNDDFPIFPADAVSSTNNSFNCNNAVFKLEFDIPDVIADFDAPDQYCVNEPVPFTNQSQGASSYSWDFGDDSPLSSETNPEHTYDSTGFYEVTLTAFSDVCDSFDTETQIIEIIESINGALEPAFSCNGDPVVLGPDDVITNYDYTWDPNVLISDTSDPNPTVSTDEEESFTLFVSHDGCVDTLSQDLEIVDLFLTAPDDLIICNPETISGTADTPDNAEVIWSTESDFSVVINTDVTDPSFEFLVNEETTFYVQSTIGDCVETDEFTVSVLSQQIQLEPDFVVCAGDTVVLSVLEPIDGLDYEWTPAENILGGQGEASITVYLTDETTFTVSAQINADCIVTDEITVGLSGLSIDQINATADPSVILTGSTSQLNAFPTTLDYVWTPASSLNNNQIHDPLASPQETTWYYVDIADGDCSYRDSVLVEVFDFICGDPSVFIPNAFTPNSNNQNEILYVRGQNLTAIELKIFDRWGQKIFETTNQNEGWDGTYKGEELDPAIFVYYLNVVCGDGQTYFEKGNISLIR